MRNTSRTTTVVLGLAVVAVSLPAVALDALAATAPVPVGTPPVAVITAPSKAYAAVPITLSGAKSTSSGSSGGTVSEWEWDLNNDGRFEHDSTSSPWVSHTFTAGPHTVVLRVRNESGLVSTAMKTLTVRKAPSAATEPAAPATVQTQVDGTTIDVTWTETLGSDAIAYRVANADDRDTDPIYVPATGDLGASFDDLVPGSYRIRVSGINRAGVGPAAESTAVVLAKGAPGNTASATPTASATAGIPTDTATTPVTDPPASTAAASADSGPDRGWIGLVLIGAGVVLLLIAAIGGGVNAMRRRRAGQ